MLEFITSFLIIIGFTIIGSSVFMKPKGKNKFVTDKEILIRLIIGFIIFLIGFIIAGYNGWTVFNK